MSCDHPACLRRMPMVNPPSLEVMGIGQKTGGTILVGDFSLDPWRWQNLSGGTFSRAKRSMDVSTSNFCGWTELDLGWTLGEAQTRPFLQILLVDIGSKNSQNVNIGCAWMCYILLDSVITCAFVSLSVIFCYEVAKSLGILRFETIKTSITQPQVQCWKSNTKTSPIFPTPYWYMTIVTVLIQTESTN